MMRLLNDRAIPAQFFLAFATSGLKMLRRTTRVSVMMLRLRPAPCCLTFFRSPFGLLGVALGFDGISKGEHRTWRDTDICRVVRCCVVVVVVRLWVKERERRGWMAGERPQVPDTLLVAPKKDALNVPLDYTVD